MPGCWFWARSNVKPKPSPSLDFVDSIAKTGRKKVQAPQQWPSQEPRLPLQALDLGRVVVTMYTGGRPPSGPAPRRYLTRFSTEYTEM